MAVKVVDCRKRDDKAIQEQLKEADVGDGIRARGETREVFLSWDFKSWLGLDYFGR